MPLLGVTSSLAIENAIKDAVDNDRDVYIVGAAGSIKRRLEDFGILNMLPSEHLLMERRAALQRAVSALGQPGIDTNGTAAVTGVETGRPAFEI